MSLCELLKNSPRNTNMLLLVPLIRLDLAKNNFIFQALCIWNGLIQKLMNRSSTNSLGIIIPGSSSNSDPGTSHLIIFAKRGHFKARGGALQEFLVVPVIT